MGMASSLPVLFPDRPSACGWLYGAFVMSGEVVSLPVLSVVEFYPVGPDDFTQECDLCGSSGPLWSWVDIWSGGISVSGVECEACIRDDDGGAEPTQGWVPSPLAITAG
jgi:hypothetical protein